MSEQDWPMEIDIKEESRLLAEEEARSAQRKHRLEEAREWQAAALRAAVEKAQREAEEKAAEEAAKAEEAAGLAKMAEENAKMAKEKAIHGKKEAAAKERASKTRLPSEQSLHPSKKARKMKEEGPMEKVPPVRSDFAEVVGYVCERCRERGLECAWLLNIDGKRARACYECVCGSQGCRLGKHLISKVLHKDHPRTLAKASGKTSGKTSGQTEQPEASGSGKCVEQEEEEYDDDFLERVAEASI